MSELSINRRAYDGEKGSVDDINTQCHGMESWIGQGVFVLGEIAGSNAYELLQFGDKYFTFLKPSSHHL